MGFAWRAMGGERFLGQNSGTTLMSYLEYLLFTPTVGKMVSRKYIVYR